jgi:hypothetical protein
VRHAGAKPKAGESVAARKGARALFAGRAPDPRELLMTRRDDIPDQRLLNFSDPDARADRLCVGLSGFSNTWKRKEGIAMKSAIRSSAVLMLLYSVLAVHLAFAQCETKTGFAKQVCEVESGKIGPVNSGPNSVSLGRSRGKPLSTNFSDTIHVDTLPPTVQPKAFKQLARLDRTNDGSFILKAGMFEAYLESYPLDFDASLSTIGGFYPAPIRGRRATVIAAVLKQAELHPEVVQGDIQALLGWIVGGADLERMPPQVQQTAARILPRETLALLQGATAANNGAAAILGYINRRASKGAQQQQNTARASGQGSDPDQDVQGGDSPSSQSSYLPVARGTWAQMPGGFYVRYLPQSPGKTVLQVMVPDTAIAQADPNAPLAFDPTQYLAVCGQSQGLRLGITMRPAR